MTNKKRQSSSLIMMGRNINKHLEEDEKISKPEAIDEIINEELQSMIIEDIPINKVYSAPSGWNQWDKLPDEKIVELMESIIDVGALQPCILWKINKDEIISFYEDHEKNNDPYGFEGNEYMILAGHNRTKARVLISQLQEHEFDERYKYIPSIVYTDPIPSTFKDKALKIIDDTNYLSREKTKREVFNAVKRRYFNNKGQSRRNKLEETANRVSKELNLSTRTVYKYVKLETDLNKKILDLVLSESISMNNGITLSEYDEDVQKILANDYYSLLIDKKKLSAFLKNTNPSMSFHEIEQILNQHEIKYEKITVNVPIGLVDEFNEMVRQWKNENLTR